MNCPLIDIHTHKPTAEGVVSPRSFGIHPWKVDNLIWEQIDLTSFQRAEVIGEIGLDKACSSEWGRQVTFFTRQLSLSEQLRKPVVIHCVRAFNELIEIRKDYKKMPWMVHGFVGSEQLAEQLVRANICISFGSAILDSHREKVRESLRFVAEKYPQFLFLETDESDSGIAAIYAETEKCLEIPKDFLLHTINNNYLALFKL